MYVLYICTGIVQYIYIVHTYVHMEEFWIRKKEKYHIYIVCYHNGDHGERRKYVNRIW